MPRAHDRFPSLRGGNDVHSPLRGLLDYTDPIGMTAQVAGDGIKGKIEDAVAFIYEQTGIDLSGFSELLAGLEGATGLDLLGLGALDLTTIIPQITDALSGIDLSSPGGVMTAIVEAVSALPGIGPIVEALTGGAIPGGTDPLEWLAGFGTNLKDFLPGVDLTSGAFNPTTAWSTWITSAIKPTGLLLGSTDPIPSGNLFGVVPAWLIGNVPYTSIGEASPNLASDPQFQNGAAFDDIEGWDHDPVVGRTTAGSAKVTCDGTLHEMINDPAIPVSVGQKVSLTIRARWAALTTSGGSPVQMGYTAYDAAGTPVASAILQSAGTGGGTSAAGMPGWVTLTGEYTVPAGVAYVVQRLVVTAQATGGTVNFDDADIHKTQPLKTAWTDGLDTALAGLWAGLGSAGDELQDLLETLAGGGGGLAAIVSRLQNIGSGGLFNAAALTNISNVPVGIPTTAVDGVAGAVDIGESVQQFLDNLGQGATNLSVEGFGFSNIRDAIGAMLGQIQDLNTTVQALQVGQGGAGNSGQYTVINVADAAFDLATLFTKVLDTGSGSVTKVSNALEMTSGVVGVESYIYTGPGSDLLTDYFKVATIMPRANARGFFGDTGSTYIYILGRTNAAGDTACVARVGADTIRIGSYKPGGGSLTAPTWFGGSQDFITPAGARVEFEGGDGIDIRNFRVYVNGQAQAVFSDTADASLYGPTLVKSGIAWQNDTNYRAASVSQFGFADNTPTPVVGSGFRAYRSGVSTVSHANGVRLANNFINVVTEITPDIVYTPGNNCEIQINTTGWYTFKGRMRRDNEVMNETGWGMTLWRDPVGAGSLGVYEQLTWTDVNIGDGSGGLGVSHQWATDVYVTAGDKFYIGYSGDGTAQLGDGDAGGTQIYMSVVLLNKSTA